MSNEMIRKQVEESLESNSLKALARENETVFLLVDTSSSMFAADVPFTGGTTRSRIDALRDVVKNVRTDNTLPMIAFGGGGVMFVNDVPDPEGGTPMHRALMLAKEYGATRVVVLSDGVPDLPDECLEQARQLGQVDVIYIGGDNAYGMKFMEQMAAASGGKVLKGDLGNIKELTSHVIAFLDGEVEEPMIIRGEGFTAAEDLTFETGPDDVEEDDDEDDDDEDDQDDDE